MRSQQQIKIIINMKNISIIELGECENELKKKYDINKNEPLLIYKTDIYEEGLLTPRIEYEIYDIKTKIN